MINTYDVSSVPDIKTELKVGLELDKTQLQARNNVVHIVEGPIKKLTEKVEDNHFDSILEGIKEGITLDYINEVYEKIDLFNLVSPETLFNFIKYNLNEQEFEDIFEILENYENIIHRLDATQIILLISALDDHNDEKIKFLQLDGISEVLQNSGK